MSLFAGLVFAHNGDVVARARQQMQNALEACAPGQASKWQSSSALIMAVSEADRPSSSSSSLRLSADGIVVISKSRLDDRQGLSHELGLPHHANETANEVDILTHGYRRWGVTCPRHFTGEFSFAVWDPKTWNFFAARDRLGVFPFCYLHDTSGLYFANSMAVLVRFAPARPLNSRLILFRMQGLMRGLKQNTSETMYKDTWRLPGGHILSCSKGGVVETKRYWSYGDIAGTASNDFEENAARLRELLIDSTRRRLPRQGCIGVELSGGLDSTAVLGAAAQSARDRIRTYSAVFPNLPEADDSALIEQAHLYHGVPNATFDPTTMDILRRFEEALEMHGDYMYAGNIHIVLRMLELARDDGCSVMLNGVDGDNVASHGLHRLTELAHAGDWQRFGALARSAADIYRGHNNTTAAGLFNVYGRNVFESKAIQGVTGELFSAALSLKLTANVPFRTSLRTIAARRLRGARPTATWRGLFREGELSGDMLRQTHYRDAMLEVIDRPSATDETGAQLELLSRGLNEHYFEIIHSNSARHGIETRYPFMDLSVVSFCLAVPSCHKLRHGWTRAFLREGMGRIYPEAVARQRRKSNLSGGLTAAIQQGCLPELERLFHDRGNEFWRYFDQNGVKRVLEKCRNGDKSAQIKVWIAWTVSRCLQLRQ